jgi:hypothetical protein
LSGQVARERVELAEKLGIHERGAELDAALGHKLYAMAFEYMRAQPGAWLRLEATKLWDTLGNHAFIRDYDLFGERELLGLAAPVGLPFGVLLGLGVLGLWLTARAPEPESRALSLVLFGQLAAVLAANLLWFTSAQNRVPLAVPLAFAAGPGVVAIAKRVRPQLAAFMNDTAPAASTLGIAVAIVLCAQAFVPRLGTYRASSVHYYNLANVEEQLGDTDAALAHYRVAVTRSPTQPMFVLRLAHLARLTKHEAEAKQSFERLLHMPEASPAIRDAARTELQLLAAAN